MTAYLIVGAVFYLGVAVAVGVVAHDHYGRSTGGWILLSLLISPALALLFLIAVSLQTTFNVSPSVPAEPVSSWECTNCHREVGAHSSSCPYCGFRRQTETLERSRRAGRS